MKRSRFTEEQIIAALKEHAAGTRTGQLCRRLGIATETLYNWKRKYGGLEVNEARRLRALEEENRQLKRIVAEQALDNRVLKDVLQSLTVGAAHRSEVAGVDPAVIVDVVEGEIGVSSINVPTT